MPAQLFIDSLWLPQSPGLQFLYSSYQWSWLQDLPKWEVGIASGKVYQENFNNKKQNCQGPDTKYGVYLCIQCKVWKYSIYYFGGQCFIRNPQSFHCALVSSIACPPQSSYRLPIPNIIIPRCLSSCLSLFKRKQNFLRLPFTSARMHH